MSGRPAEVRPGGGVPSGRPVGRAGAVVRPAVDLHTVRLMGTVARGPRVVRGVLEVTLAGQVTRPGEGVLPWYHRVLMDASSEVQAGEVFGVEGTLRQQKFRSKDGQNRSVFVVRSERIVRPDLAGVAVRRVPDREGNGVSFILLGGPTEVMLRGNLSRAAEPMIAPSGDPFTRLTLGVKDAGGGTQFLPAKAWRDQSLRADRYPEITLVRVGAETEG